ncbi:hypothetical protein J6590_054385 [Homalodisca vitripennis]|nr:hypothetical protein J6590_054385 [Homalodisca vitripennis]
MRLKSDAVTDYTLGIWSSHPSEVNQKGRRRRRSKQTLHRLYIRHTKTTKELCLVYPKEPVWSTVSVFRRCTERKVKWSYTLKIRIESTLPIIDTAIIFPPKTYWILLNKSHVPRESAMRSRERWRRTDCSWRSGTAMAKQCNRPQTIACTLSPRPRCNARPIGFGAFVTLRQEFALGSRRAAVSSPSSLLRGTLPFCCHRPQNKEKWVNTPTSTVEEVLGCSVKPRLPFTLFVTGRRTLLSQDIANSSGKSHTSGLSVTPNKQGPMFAGECIGRLSYDRPIPPRLDTRERSKRVIVPFFFIRTEPSQSGRKLPIWLPKLLTFGFCLHCEEHQWKSK